MSNGLLGRLGVELYADMSRFAGDLGKAQKNVDDFVGNITSGLGKVSGAFAALSGSAVVGGFAFMTKQSLDVAEAFNKLSQKTGIAVAQLSELAYAANLADVSQETLGKGIKNLSEYMVAANDPMSQQARLLKQLGVNAKGDTVAALQQLAKTFEALPDGATKAALATELFKKSGQEMIPFLNQGAEGIAKMRDEARRLGLTVSKETAQQAEQFNDNIKALTASTGRFGMAIVNEFSPAMVKASDAMKQALIDSGNLTAAWVGLGAVGAFLFTDDMLSSQQKLQKEMRELESRIEELTKAKSGWNGLGLIDWLLGYDDQVIDKKIAETTQKLRNLQATIAGDDKARAAAERAAADRKAAQDKEAQALDQRIRNQLAAQKVSDDVARWNDRLRQEDIKGWVAYIDAQQKAYEEQLMNIARFSDERAKLENKFSEEQIKAIDAVTQEQARALDSIQTQIDARQLEIDTFGMTKSAALEYSAALLKARAAAMSLDEATEAQIASMNAQAELMLQLAGREGYLEAMQQQAKENEDAFKNVFNLLDGGFKSALQGARSFGEYLRNGLKNAIYQLVAQPFIINIAASLTGASSQVIASALGSSAGARGFGSLLSGSGALGSLGTLGSAFGNGMTFGSSVGIGGTLANLGAGGGSFGFQAGSVMGAAAPYIAAAMAAYQLFQTFRDKGENPRYRLGFGDAAQAYASDSMFGRQGFVYAEGNDAANQATRNFQRGFDGLDKAIAKLLTSDQIAAAIGRLNNAQSREFSFPKGDGTASEQLSLEFLKIKYSAVFADLDKTFADYIRNFSGNSQDLIKEIGTMTAVFESLSQTTIRGLTLDALRAFQLEGENLADTFGRIAKGFGEYESLFVPAAERNEKAFDALRNTLQEQNAVLPATREGYRRLVESLDLSNESQRRLWQTLIDAAGVADAYYQSIEGGSSKIDKAAELRIQLMELEGDTAGALAARRAAELATLDDTSAALQRLIYQRQDEAAAAKKAADASVQAMAQALDAIRQIQSFRTGNNSIIANTLRGRAGFDFGSFLSGNVSSARATLIGATSIGDRLAAAGGLRDALGAQYQYQFDLLRQAQQAQAASMSAQIDAQRKLADQAKQLADTFRSIGAYGRSLLQSDLSTLSPEAKLTASQRDFQSMLARARAGDLSAASGLQGAAQTYLQNARDFFGSSPAFAAIFDSTQQSLEGFTSAADQQAAYAEAMLAQTESMQANIERLSTELTPEMIALQDEYIEELKLLNANSEAWEQEQRDIAARNAATYLSIEMSSRQVAENTAGLRADIQALLATQRQATAVIINDLPTFGNALGNVSKNTAITAGAAEDMSNDAALTRARALVNG